MKKMTWERAMQAVILAAAVVCLILVVLGNEQASMSIPVPLTLEGEYSQNGGPWQPWNDGEELSALEGDLVLRGHFVGGIPQGARLNMYIDHIGFSLWVNGELYIMNAVMETAQRGADLTPSRCGRWWYYMTLPEITGEDEVELRLHNPHGYGNGGAYRSFLDSMCITPDSADVLEKALEPYCRPFNIMGWSVLITALLFVGAALAAAILRSPVSGKLWSFGLLSLFAGGFLLLDTIKFSFFKGLLVFHTYGRQLCMMLFVLWLGFCAAQCLGGRSAQLARGALALSGGLDLLLILLSCSGVTVIYDTLPWWALSQALLCPLLLVCCLLGLRRGGGEDRPFLLCCLLLLVTVLLDLVGVGASLYSSGTCTKVAFTLTFLFQVVRLAVRVVRDNQTSARVRAMEREVEDSRIAIMLSQIKPHFLYNSLATIQALCHSDPPTAERVVGQFAHFLRGNMEALTTDVPIPFERELDHTRSYLEIESLRFPEQLNVRFAIEAVDFRLPTLTLQPIVENAVRHGIRKREGTGTVTISSREYPDRFEVEVEDDGVGFDPEQCPQKDGAHVGLSNVRERLGRMCGGTLRVTSQPGVGTRVVLILPKEEKRC